ncbi:MAG: hypothetical protein D6814_02465 [Calditrichaeota bacterium]|nr:MAG: hypothetical protein D6814_02465 [Calditrichota bacterium]
MYHRGEDFQANGSAVFPPGARAAAGQLPGTSAISAMLAVDTRQEKGRGPVLAYQSFFLPAKLAGEEAGF